MEQTDTETESTSTNLVTDEEIQWMIAKRPLILSEEQLVVDYGEEYTTKMLSAFQKNNLSEVTPCLAWHGVSSRWEQFLEWLLSLDETKRKEEIAKGVENIFRGFANHLGRVVSHRALSLTDEAFAFIKQNDSIFPSGRLRTDSATIDNYITKKGVRYILYGRLYIGLGLLEYDPSLSLHDDPETAVCIAEGYMSLPTKKIHLMAMDVPKIEVNGFKVSHVQDKSREKRWFSHRGVWFDADNERTERYTLYEIPFFAKRCRSVRIFNSKEEVKNFIAPFKEKQLLLYQQDQVEEEGRGSGGDEDLED